MTAAFHRQVSLARIKNEDANRTVKLVGVTAADTGKAISLDAASGANCFKLAGDGDTIVGRLEVYESDGAGTVSFQFTDPLPIKAGQTVAVGDTVVGAGGGEVKAAASADHSKNFVVEVANGKAVVVRL